MLPPGPRIPGLVALAAYVVSRRRFLGALKKRYGSTFSLSMPPFGNVVVLTSADLTKQLLSTKPEVAGSIQPDLGNVLGPGSTFALEGQEHLRRRRLMAPPFHGRRLRTYEDVMVEEASREAATWPQGVEFETTPAFLRLTLAIILRAVLGATGKHYDDLQRLMPEVAELGARLTVAPIQDRGRPWGAWARYRRLRREYDEVALDLIATARRDPDLNERDDVLAMLIQAHYDDGSQMTDQEIADELLTMLGAGHETTANTLAWAFERLTRHPRLLDRLVAEVDAGGDELLTATIFEVQRARPVITEIGRKVLAPSMELGPWRLPRGHQVIAAVDFVQADPNAFVDPDSFAPDRFLSARPESSSWIPFGGGTRRCIGAAFADMEMKVVLRTLLQGWEFAATTAPDEAWSSRGVSWTPADGGRVKAYRRAAPQLLPIDGDAATAASR
ncbi:cytochrome P450 [Nocardioides zeae]|uniref:Cytochrome P450 n=1 Tax=Nocardioides zeae TaxID=1457234 RepID=A0ACC6IEG7_9ACTN|nr:cytochrome P450 [Nocardioides zeae]MDR6209008.1 cytochrome P450 [Nocardioides zeae]